MKTNATKEKDLKFRWKLKKIFKIRIENENQT